MMSVLGCRNLHSFYFNSEQAINRAKISESVEVFPDAVKTDSDFQTELIVYLVNLKIFFEKRQKYMCMQVKLLS